MNQNPCLAPWLTPEMRKGLSSIQRLDRDGYLYSMDCAWEYDAPIAQTLAANFHLFQAGCSVFMTHTHQNGILTCRNYDYSHRKYNQKDGEFAGANVLLHCARQGKYRSVCMADAFWLDGTNGTFFQGVLDDGKTDISLAALLPYVCMDGMNEKGVTVSILSQPLPQGEQGVRQDVPERRAFSHTILMRYILDDCASVAEAVAYAQSVNIVSHNGAEYHIFVADRTGKSVVLEWRHDALHVIDTDICTNFFVGFDDCADRYRDGKLSEHAVRLENVSREYHYGYGGGYQRFAILLGQLEMYRDRDSVDCHARMTRERADIAIQSVIQGINAEKTSYTQYSVIYDQHALKLRLRVGPKYRRVYAAKL